ncbi:MAG: hypothetical protein JXB49_36850 [Bacteroidales bacterium]|nr:hypothetical protein [Bacteroidales bacterium]
MFISHMPPDKLHGRKAAYNNLKLKVLFNLPTNPPDTSFLIVMVRIIDKLIDQRRIVFTNIHKCLSDNDGKYLCLAASHAEDLISDAKRIVSFIRAHRSMKASQVKVDKELYKRIISKEQGITDFRNALQHLDKDISSGTIQTGQDYGLILTDKGYRINNSMISYEDFDDFLLACDRYIKNVIEGM